MKIPILKFNAKSGRWSLLSKKTIKEIENPSFLLEFDQIKTGWFLFRPNKKPLIKLNYPVPRKKPRKFKGMEYKSGFIVNGKGTNFEGTFEFSSSSYTTKLAISKLYDEYLAKKKRHKGKSPIIETGEPTALRLSEYNFMYVPTFKIWGWR